MLPGRADRTASVHGSSLLECRCRCKYLSNIGLHERVGIHDEEIRNVSKVSSGKLVSASGPEWTRFFRVFNGHIPVMAISEFVLDLLSKIPGTHHQTANFLVAELPNQ